MTQHSVKSAALSSCERSETTLSELRDEDLRAVSGGNLRRWSLTPPPRLITPIDTTPLDTI